MTVYVIQPPPKNRHGWSPDLSSAAEYGEIQFVFDDRDRVYALPGPSLFKARKIAAVFDCDKDYILWPNIGDPMALACFLLAMKDKDMPHCNFLYWNRKRNEDGTRDSHSGYYVPVKFNLKDVKVNDGLG